MSTFFVKKIFYYFYFIKNYLFKNFSTLNEKLNYGFTLIINIKIICINKTI
jgi:hypothetical protein